MMNKDDLLGKALKNKRAALDITITVGRPEEKEEEQKISGLAPSVNDKEELPESLDAEDLGIDGNEVEGLSPKLSLGQRAKMEFLKKGKLQGNVG